MELLLNNLPFGVIQFIIINIIIWVVIGITAKNK